MGESWPVDIMGKNTVCIQDIFFMFLSHFDSNINKTIKQLMQKELKL